ncbi:MAG: DUF72 domain-containing protein [Acidimicrobiales bacterium]
MARGTARVGCSGWDYPHWKGAFYPSELSRDDWFGRYASEFDTVELNSTFYRLPSTGTVDRWAEQAPAGFVYAVKLGQYASHRKKLKDPQQWLANHIDRAEHLGAALGPTLVQLPPRWHRDTGRLDEFLAATRGHGRWAVELRDPSWLHPDVYEVLRRHGAALCLHDLLADHPWELTTDWTYLRFHGPDATDAPYRGRYTGRRLGPIARRLERWLVDGVDVYAYFNNDDRAFATVDAAWLRDRLRAAPGSS